MEQFRQAFEAEYDVPVQVYQLGFGDIRDQLVLRGPLGEGPDLIIGAHDWLGELVTNGVVAPLDLGDAADNIDPVALQAFTYDGQLYGLPYAQEAIALYYNADLVPTPPATWEDLKTIARDLQADGTVEQAYLLQQADPYHSYPILSGMGGYIFGQDAEGNYDPSDVGLDSEGGLAYARELDSMVKEGLLRAGVDYGAAEAMMHDGSAAMWITGPWALTGMRDSGQNIQVAQIPTIDGTAAAPFVGVHAFMVSADAPNQLLAEAFLTEFVATDQSMGALFDADPRPPTWLPLRELIADEAIAEFTESASQGNPMPAIPEMSAVWESWTDAINFIFDQTQDAEQAARDAAENIRTTIGD
jgi:maltose-binding protein MalE